MSPIVKLYYTNSKLYIILTHFFQVSRANIFVLRAKTIHILSIDEFVDCIHADCWRHSIIFFTCVTHKIFFGRNNLQQIVMFATKIKQMILVLTEVVNNWDSRCVYYPWNSLCVIRLHLYFVLKYKTGSLHLLCFWDTVSLMDATFGRLCFNIGRRQC